MTTHINGSVTIGFNFDDVNIYIANLYANSINRYNSISEDKKSIELEIEPGVTNIDIYITNNASQYDEFASMACNADDLNGVTISNNSYKTLSIGENYDDWEKLPQSSRDAILAKGWLISKS